MIALLALLVSATVQPAAPQVGDLITVTFAAPVTLDASTEYEVVQHRGAVVVVRTFKPAPFTMSGTVGGTRFTDFRVAVTSVLKVGDDLAPAALAAPRPAADAVVPLIAIAVAALCALAVWATLWLHARRAPRGSTQTTIAVGAEERYRRAIEALRSNPGQAPWAQLADETRMFLAATRSDLGKDLTTSEILPRVRQHEEVVREILLQGDLEKFSLRGARARDFDEVAAGALELAQPRAEEAAA